MEEERRFTVLLERVEQQYQLLSEKVSGLDGGFKFLTQQADDKTPRWGCANSAPCAGDHS